MLLPCSFSWSIEAPCYGKELSSLLRASQMLLFAPVSYNSLHTENNRPNLDPTKSHKWLQACMQHTFGSKVSLRTSCTSIPRIFFSTYFWHVSSWSSVKLATINLEQPSSIDSFYNKSAVPHRHFKPETVFFPNVKWLMRSPSIIQCENVQYMKKHEMQKKKEKEKERGDTSTGLPCIAIRPLRCETKTNRIQQH